MIKKFLVPLPRGQTTIKNRKNFVHKNRNAFFRCKRNSRLSNHVIHLDESNLDTHNKLLMFQNSKHEKYVKHTYEIACKRLTYTIKISEDNATKID